MSKYTRLTNRGGTLGKLQLCAHRSASCRNVFLSLINTSKEGDILYTQSLLSVYFSFLCPRTVAEAIQKHPNPSSLFMNQNGRNVCSMAVSQLVRLT